MYEKKFQLSVFLIKVVNRSIYKRYGGEGMDVSPVYRISQYFGQPGLCVKIRQNFLLAYICMAIPYGTAKFKSANILVITIWGSTAKFNSRQYFRLYGIYTSNRKNSLCLFIFSLSPSLPSDLRMLTRVLTKRRP